jgi:hypothetical protein
MVHTVDQLLKSTSIGSIEEGCDNQAPITSGHSKSSNHRYQYEHTENGFEEPDAALELLDCVGRLALFVVSGQCM